MDRLELPIVVCGERKYASGGNTISMVYDSGLEVRLPALEPDDVARIKAQSNQALRQTHIDDIAIFMNDLGKRWLDEESEFRQLAIQYSKQTTAYVGPSIYYDLGLLSTALRRPKIYDMLESELGNPYYLDEWIPSKTVYLHAEPRGKVLHIVAGNIPMVGLFSVVRSVLTKNLTIVKLPKRDPLTTLLFALSFIDFAPDHPITKSISAVYWPSGSPIEEELLPSVDVVCAWGRRDAIQAIKRKVPYGTDFIEFGPKRSLHLVGREAKDYDQVAMRAAYDISIYNQEACFSPQETFFEGDPTEYVARLQFWLERNQHRIPPGPICDDSKAHISLTRSNAKFRGWKVYDAGHTGWTIIVTDKPCTIEQHPLHQTIFIHPVNDLREAFEYLSKNVQTVGVFPPERAMALADDLVERGVSRITEIGRAGRPRPGFTHDGMHPMDRLIRWVTVERGVRFKYKFWALSPEEDERLFYGLGQETDEEDPMLVWKAYEEVNLK